MPGPNTVTATVTIEESKNQLRQSNCEQMTIIIQSPKASRREIAGDFQQTILSLKHYWSARGAVVLEHPHAKPPRELTEGEVRSKLLRYIWGAIDEWARYPSKPTRDRLSGLTHTILAMLDGESIELPAFIIAPDPASCDKEWHQEHGESWWPENYDVKVNCDLGGSLHDRFYEEEPK